MQRVILIVGLLLLLGSCVVGATAFRDQVASAGGQRTHKTARRAAQPPMPVEFTNGSGVSTGNTVKIDPAANGVSGTVGLSAGTAVGLTAGTTVGLSGSANTVKIDPAANIVSVAPPTPIADGGSAFTGRGTIPTGTQTASALVIHMTAGVSYVKFTDGLSIPALFAGPFEAGSADISLALTRPITFTSVLCNAPVGDACSVSWVGDSP